MVERGAATRAKLISATQQVVHEIGYAHATTRAIAEAAGVAEGTIYRHFPDKVALFFAAALEQDSAVIEELTSLPAQAGRSTVTDNLTIALERLATLREKVMPLELALHSDPELIERRRTMAPPISLNGPTPPEAIAQYLVAEQERGRIRSDIDCLEAALVLLATLFGIGLMPTQGPGADTHMIRRAVELFVHGMEE
jgi:AcrR family transcriptional regulator